MDDREKALQKIRAGQFRENNGRVMKTINLLRTQFVRLKDVHTALHPIEEGAMLDSVNYLQEAKYIHLRSTETKELMLLADVRDYQMLEAKLTDKGIRLLEGSEKDAVVVI